MNNQKNILRKYSPEFKKYYPVQQNIYHITTKQVKFWHTFMLLYFLLNQNKNIADIHDMSDGKRYATQIVTQRKLGQLYEDQTK